MVIILSSNKVSITIRLDPKLHAYIKQQAPDNRSAFMEELVRKHSLDNIEDDVMARLKQTLLADERFLEAVSSKLNKQPAATALQVDPRFPGRAWDPRTEEWVSVV